MCLLLLCKQLQHNQDTGLELCSFMYCMHDSVLKVTIGISGVGCPLNTTLYLFINS